MTTLHLAAIAFFLGILALAVMCVARDVISEFWPWVDTLEDE